MKVVLKTFLAQKNIILMPQKILEIDKIQSIIAWKSLVEEEEKVFYWFFSY